MTFLLVTLFLGTFCSPLPSGSLSFQGRCTYHDYQGDQQRFGVSVYDNNPPWCGHRYSDLQLGRVMAVHGLDGTMCNQCFQVIGSAGSVYILAVDQKADEGLDIAKTSFEELFPGQDPLNPQICTWTQVDASYCSGICNGSPLECTPGLRNTLPPLNLIGGPGVSADSSGDAPNSSGSSPNSSGDTTNSSENTPNSSGPSGILNLPLSTAVNCIEGQLSCSGTGFNTCVFGQWVYRDCNEGLACKQVNDFDLYCDYSNSSS